MPKTMRLLLLAVLCGWLIRAGVSAAPLPPAIEKTSKEGIAATRDVTIQGSLSDMELEGSHLVKLSKGQVYAIELGSPGLKVKLRIDGFAGLPVAFPAGQKTFKPDQDGTYRFRVSSAAGAAGKYMLSVRPLPPEAGLPPGVHAVGAGGLTIEGVLDNNDPIDKTHQQLCKNFEVKMEAGKAYTIDMISQQMDSFLRLEDAAGKQLAQDDDSGGNLNARIVFRPQEEGVYRVITTTCAGGVGNFTLKVREQ
jgi:hypothetical protein